jgi:hypothetical protein
VAIVNAGYRRSATVYRSDAKTFEPRAFKAFGPAAIAGIGHLEATTESRCIPIVLSRKPRGSCERYIEHLVEAHALALSEKLAAWATEATAERLRRSVPSYPEVLSDRQVETWWGILAIADEAGGEWPELAREAAVALHGDADQDTLSLGVLLLSHIRVAFEEKDTDRMSSADLLKLLVANEEGPWARYWATEVGREGTPQAAAGDLAGKLRGFRVKPKKIRLLDGTTARGYMLEDFQEAFHSYLVGGTVEQGGTGLTSDVPGVPLVPPPSPKPAKDRILERASDEGRLVTEQSLELSKIARAAATSRPEHGGLVASLEAKNWPKRRIGSITVGPGEVSWRSFLKATKIPVGFISEAVE